MIESERETAAPPLQIGEGAVAPFGAQRVEALLKEGFVIHVRRYRDGACALVIQTIAYRRAPAIRRRVAELRAVAERRPSPDASAVVGEGERSLKPRRHATSTEIMPGSERWPETMPACLRLCLLFAALLALAGCDLPKDPQRTAERVIGGTIRVGVAGNAPWAALSNGEPEGVECDLVRELAAALNAKIVWVRGGESGLLHALEDFEIDLVIGGIDDRSAWRDRVGLTRPYYRSPAERLALPESAPTTFSPRERRHVFAAPPGENGWILRLDRFLHDREAAIADRLPQHGA